MASQRTEALNEPELVGQSGRYLPPWQVGDLPEPPRPGWKLWIGLIGPGIVLAGTSIGSGEWLFGPAVTAQYWRRPALARSDQHPASGLLQPDDDALHRL